MQGFAARTGLELSGFEIKAISDSRSLHGNGLHFGRGSSLPEKLDKSVSGRSKCLLVNTSG